MSAAAACTNKGIAIFAAAGLAMCVSCSGGGSFDSVSGTITVDGAPVDAGTISMQPVDEGSGSPAGGAIQDGKFQVAARDGISSGKYRVQVQASKKTGRMKKDPQRGDVEEYVPLTLADSPKEIELSSTNAENLELSFRTGSP
jgi:hypothetical protein